MIKINLVILFVLILTESYGQKEAHYWVFGYNVGINFNDNFFIPFNGTKMDQGGGSASISNPITGELLLYTDGRHVFNRSFNLMPNGTGLNGGLNTPQAALIVPHPGNSKYYVVFTTRSYSDSLSSDGGSINTGLYYSIVDMNAENGKGNVLSDKKNILLHKKATEKLTAVPHSNLRDYWIISHDLGSNNFLVYILNDEGVELSNYFALGTEYGHDESRGWMLPSPDGTMLASAPSSHPYETSPLELYDFNSLTGEISNYRILGNYSALNGISFSPDNSKLYFSHTDPKNINNSVVGTLSQLDLEEKSLEAIINSKTDIIFPHQIREGREHYDSLSGGVLQLAPDGRLYTSITGRYLTAGSPEPQEAFRIFYINKPNLPGLLCEPSNRKFKAIIKTGNGSSFPNLIQANFNNLEPVDNFVEIDKDQSCEDLVFSLYPNPTEDVVKINMDQSCNLTCLLTIYSASGQLLERFDITNNSFTIKDMSLYASGLYLFVFQFPNKKIIKKIIRV